MTPVVGTIDNARIHLGDKVMPGNTMRDYLQTEACCRLHVAVDDVVEKGTVLLGERVGAFSAISLAARGVFSKCFAEESGLKLDKYLALSALDFSIPGYAYVRDDGLCAVWKMETSSVADIRMFGVGYCYLRLVRPRVRLRVARILGPCPLLLDFLLLYRLTGLSVAFVNVRSVGVDLFHVEESVQKRTGLELARELLGLVSMSIGARIGMDVGLNEGSANGVDVPIGRKGKVKCGVCGKVVSPANHSGCKMREMMDCTKCGCSVLKAGHESRCRIVVDKDPAMELIGDAMHGLDVKIFALYYGRNRGYSKFASELMDARAQRSYLESMGVELGNVSDHSWGSEFERRYHGEFRKLYLENLISMFYGTAEADTLAVNVAESMVNYDVTFVPKVLGGMK